MKYQKKPVVIDAYCPSQHREDPPKWYTGAIQRDSIRPATDGGHDIRTLEGVMHASRGDYIIHGVHGELYPCKPDIFNDTYQQAEIRPCPPRCIAIDFDGTICTEAWPGIGEPNWPVIDRAKAEQTGGAELILWTVREGEQLIDAIIACKNWGLQFDAVNESTPSWRAYFGNNPRKVGADEYWDDRAVSTKAWTRCPK